MYNPDLQVRCREKKFLPSKTPRSRASLPRLSDEMSYQRKFHYNHEFNNSESSNSNYSDESDDSDNSNTDNVNSHSSSLSSKTPSPNPQRNKNYSSTIKKRRNSTKSNQSSNSTNKNEFTLSLNNTSKNNESTNSNLFIIIISVFIIIGLFFIFPEMQKVFAINNNNNNNSTPESREKILKNVENEIRELKKEFRNQEKKIWPEIYSGIIDVINNPTRPSIFVLFADRNDLMSCLALTIGELGRMAFGTEKSLTVKPTQLNSDTGDVIDKLRLVIPQRKSVIFWDFLSINDKALKAFHFICDRENPLVQQAIYVITVKAEGYHESENPLRFIENKLRSNLTGRIKEDSLMPLITRITDGPIISVKPEFNMQCKFKNTLDY